MPSGRLESENHSLRTWVIPPDTSLIPYDQYIDLKCIDISNIPLSVDSLEYGGTISDNLKDVSTRAINSLRSNGFIVIEGHGLSDAELQHHLSLGKLLMEEVSSFEKHDLHARIKEGSWAGYKPQGYYKRPDGSFDYLEHYDFYPFTALRSNLPQISQPYLPDFRKFIEHNHYVILRKVLGVISLGLGLDVDALWRLHHRGNSHTDDTLRGSLDGPIKWDHSKDHLRYGMYHPSSEEDRTKRNLWLPGHTDIGSVTFLYSQPIAGLQVLTPNGDWRYIRHYPNSIIIGLGDCMEFLTGGILKAPPHRVVEPPEDQKHLRRLGIFYFVPFLPDVILKPIDHPSLHDMGAKDIFEEYYALGGKPLTSEEWLVEKSKLVGTKRIKREHREARDVLEDIHFRYNPS